MTEPDAGSDHFFTQLPAIRRFESISRLERFYPAPTGWLVAIADVEDSTAAVEQGQYKQVNMIGASCITAVINAVDDIDIPFVFGGDGATLLIPQRVRAQAEKALSNTRAMAKNRFGIGLRFGFVPVEDIRAAGKDIHVARLELSPGNNLALFSGGGTELADRWIKLGAGARQYAVADCPSDGEPDLSGLSCRWQPLRSQRGRMLCLLIRASAGGMRQRHQVYSKVLDGIRGITGQELRNAGPVNASNMRFIWPPSSLKIEARLTQGRGAFWQRYLRLLYQSFVQFILERFNLSAGGYNAPEYRGELRANADYRRLDDTLRLVLDCSGQQIGEITALLDARHHQGEIAYGMHQSLNAQMTCLVFSLEKSEHLHFIDGAEGGFWAAAVKLKQQLAAIG